MANSQETNVNLKINRVPDKATLEDMIANNQIQPNQLYMLPSELGSGVVTMQTKVLWTNPSPTSSFAAQTITVEDMSEYDYLMFNFLGAINVDWGFSQLVKKELGHRLFYGDGDGQKICIRNFTIDSDTSITFEAARYNNANTNSELIPTQIIGIKLIESPTQITNKYSTEETVVGEWIDGKKIYRKVFTGTFGSSIGHYTMGYIPNISTLVNSYGYYLQTPYITPINTTYNSDLSSVVQIDNTNGRITVAIKNSLLNKNYTFTLEYTKTTD